MSPLMVEPLESRCLFSASPHAILVKDINPGPTSSVGMPWALGRASDMVALGDEVFFTADDGTHGRTLWKSDGTPDGTRMVRAKLGYITQLASMGGNLYFIRNLRQLWRSDGSPGGTVLVKDFGRAGASFVGSWNNGHEQNAPFPGHLIIASAHQLWSSDGTRNGTDLLRTFSLFPPDTLTVAGDRFFFTVSSFNWKQPDRSQLWVSDGTRDGTYLLKRLTGRVNIDAPLGNSVLLSTFDPNDNATDWISDGTPAGTHRSPWPISEHGAVYLNNRIYFLTENLTQRGEYVNHDLWAADPTLTTRTLVKEFPRGDDVFNMQLAFKNEVYFTLDDGVHGVELMKTDGTQSGTVLVKNIYHGGLGSNPDWFTILDNKLIFTAKDNVHGHGIWATDGTTQGTRLVQPMPNGYLDVNNFYNSGSAVYITLANGHVWKTDGSPDGTHDIGAFWGGRSSATSFTTAAGLTFFMAGDDKHGAELRMSP